MFLIFNFFATFYKYVTISYLMLNNILHTMGHYHTLLTKNALALYNLYNKLNKTQMVNLHWTKAFKEGAVKVRRGYASKK